MRSNRANFSFQMRVHHMATLEPIGNILGLMVTKRAPHVDGGWMDGWMDGWTDTMNGLCDKFR